MKILYTNFHRDSGGGHTTYIRTLARALVEKHRIDIAAPESSWLYQEAMQIPGVRVHALPFSKNFFGIVNDASTMRGLLRTANYDIVHVNGSADHRCVMLAAMNLGRIRPRIVFTKHNDFPVNSIGNRLRARFATDCTICVSEYTRSRLSKTAYRHTDLCVVHNGVDTAHYAPQDMSATAQARFRWLPGDAPADSLIIGSNAGTAPYKCWLDMVRAVANLPESIRRRVFILLAGSPFNAAQRAEIHTLNMSDRVIHVGLLQDVRPFIAALDVGFVLSRHETISFACREMMSMGKPVIVAKTGGLPENITPGVDGWVVPAQTPSDVESVLQAIAAHPDVLITMGQAARAKSVAEFGLDGFVQKTEQVYQNVCGAR